MHCGHSAWPHFWGAEVLFKIHFQPSNLNQQTGPGVAAKQFAFSCSNAGRNKEENNFASSGGISLPGFGFAGAGFIFGLLIMGDSVLVCQPWTQVRPKRVIHGDSLFGEPPKLWFCFWCSFKTTKKGFPQGQTQMNMLRLRCGHWAIWACCCPVPGGHVSSQVIPILLSHSQGLHNTRLIKTGRCHDSERDLI